MQTLSDKDKFLMKFNHKNVLYIDHSDEKSIISETPEIMINNSEIGLVNLQTDSITGVALTDFSKEATAASKQKKIPPFEKYVLDLSNITPVVNKKINLTDLSIQEIIKEDESKYENSPRSQHRKFQNNENELTAKILRKREGNVSASSKSSRVMFPYSDGPHVNVSSKKYKIDKLNRMF